MFQSLFALLSSRFLRNVESLKFRCDVGEALVRLCFVEPLTPHLSMQSSGDSTLVVFPPKLLMQLEELENMIWCNESIYSERERTSVGVIILVMVKQCRGIMAKCTEVASHSTVSDVLYRSTLLLLQLIRGRQERVNAPPMGSESANAASTSMVGGVQEPSSQDICCTALCMIYNISVTLQARGSHDGNMELMSLSTRISSLVISTLSREKKSILPAGFALAGEQTSTSFEGDMARSIERQQHGNETSGGNPAAMTMSGTPQDMLAAAAATAASEFNIYNLQAEADASTATRNSRTSIQDGNYGIYTKICLVGKKTGDPSVVFAVLSLVKRDPAFGISGSDTADFVARYQAPIAPISKSKISQLIPVLYMSRFDPNTVIREVMLKLWDILVPLSQAEALLRSHQDELLKYFLINLSNRNWKDRESACLALEIQLQRMPWYVIKKHLLDLWNGGMCVLDDIRDSIRAAALRFMKILSDQIIRACNPAIAVSAGVRFGSADASSGVVLPQDKLGIAQEASAVMVPLLLEKGLLASSAEGRGYSLGLLLNIVKVAQSSLTLHLVKLIAVLVESMSAMEPKLLQYMEFHTSRLQISNEELESTRLKLSQQSLMQEALDVCLQSLYQEVIPQTVMNLCMQTQEGVGLATRVTAIRSLIYIFNNYPRESQSLAKSSFKSIMSSLLPNVPSSVSLRKELVSGIGELSKAVSDDFLVSVLKDLVAKENALTRDDSNVSLVIGECIRIAISRTNEKLQGNEDADMKHFWQSLLIVSYVNTFYEIVENKDMWLSVMNEALQISGYGTKVAMLNDVLPHVIRHIVDMLQSLSWIHRTQGLAALRDIYENISPQQDISFALPELLFTLFKSMCGQIWTGQENAIELLSLSLARCPAFLDIEDNGETLLTLQVVPIYESFSNEAVNYSFLLSSDMNSKTELIENTISRLSTMKQTFLQAHVSHVDYFPLCKSWKVGWKSLVEVYVRALSRGNKQYKLSVVRSLNLLPWNLLATKKSWRSVFSEQLPMLCTLAEMGGTWSADSGVDVKESQSKADDEANRQMHAVRRSKFNKFGDRYDHSKKTLDHSSSNALKRAKVEVKYDCAFASDQVEYDGGGDMMEEQSGNGDEVKSDDVVQVVHMDVGDNEVNEEEVREEGGEEGGDVDEVVDGSSLLVPGSVAVEDAGDIVQLMEEVGVTREDCDHLRTRNNNHPNPAMCVKFLDTMAKGWPASPGQTALEVREDESFVVIADFSRLIVNWTVDDMLTEVWSIRRAEIQVLIAIVKYGGLLETEMEKVLLIIESGSKDSKYSQVRAASFDLLTAVIENCNKFAHFERFITVISSIIRSVGNETSPNVLLSHQRSQDVFLQLTSLFAKK